MNNFDDEVCAYSSLGQHENTVKLVECKKVAIQESESRWKEVAYIALELAPKGELFDYVKFGAFDERVCRAIFHQLLKAVFHLHSWGLAHRDLKLENIMLDNEFNVKLADFGFTKSITGQDGSGRMLTKLGTGAYMAPELISE
jgi:serine/threonine protein kinase